MKATLEQMREKFMSLSANRADELAAIYGGPGAESLDRPAQWLSMTEDSLSSRTYLENALGLGRDPAEEPEPSADDRAAAALLENPTLSPREITVEAGTKAVAPKAGTFGHRSQEELAEIMYGRGRH